jgi:hypothetical protein
MAIWPTLYCIWATLAIGLSIMLAGLSPENITRILVIVFLLFQIALRSKLAQAFFWLSCKARFIVLGTAFAAVVEGFHMISMPVFPLLRINGETPLMQALLYYALDLILTMPAYLVIFSVIWSFIRRYYFTLWQYVVVIGLAQSLGDGGLFYFINAPAMLFFLPYPMTNYHAINVIPFLAVREYLPPERSAGAGKYLAVPTVIGTYMICGALIKFLGRVLALETT